MGYSSVGAQDHLQVFLYHQVLPDEESGDKFSVSLSLFRQQICRMRQSAMPFFLLRELVERRENHLSGIVLSFDDGCEAEYKFALPVLQANELRAEFYISTANVGKTGFLNWSQLAEMHAAGMSIQSHSHEHVPLTLLTDTELRNQLAISKRTIEDRLGCSVDVIACPYGFFNRRVIDQSREVGYKALCTSRTGIFFPGSFEVNRIPIYRDTSVKQLGWLLEGNRWVYAHRTLRDFASNPAKQLLLRWYPKLLGVQQLLRGTT